MLAPFDHGYGLLQIQRAYDHAVEHCRDPERDVRFEVRVDRPGAPGQRGIYLREPRETLLVSAVDASVQITPVFPKDTPAATKIAFASYLTLRTTHPWLKAPLHMALMNEARSFSMQIDVSALPVGLHYAEVCGYAAGATPTSGPLFRVPVTVVKPEVVPDEGRASLSFPSLNLSPGKLHRFFVAAPENATWARVEYDAGDTFEGERLFVLHALQVLPQLSYKAKETDVNLRMSARDHREKLVPVQGGATVEFCVGQWWSSLGSSEVSATCRIERKGRYPGLAK